MGMGLPKRGGMIAHVASCRLRVDVARKSVLTGAVHEVEKYLKNMRLEKILGNYVVKLKKPCDLSTYSSNFTETHAA
jgi:hypothetical protein